MLVQAPYEVPVKKATGKAKGVRSGPLHKGSSDATSEDKTRSSAAKDDDEEEEEDNYPPKGKEEKGGLHKPRGEGTQEGESTTGISYFAVCHGRRQRKGWRTAKAFAVCRGRQKAPAK